MGSSTPSHKLNVSNGPFLLAGSEKSYTLPSVWILRKFDLIIVPIIFLMVVSTPFLKIICSISEYLISKFNKFYLKILSGSMISICLFIFVVRNFFDRTINGIGAIPATYPTSKKNFDIPFLEIMILRVVKSRQ